MWARCRTSWRIRSCGGQATVEAAVLLPVLMLLVALLVQPVCVLYTRMVMRSAAAESARLLATSLSQADVVSFALRRLEAVPEASLFHVGGSGDWEVTVGVRDEGRVAVTEVCGHVRPLPLLGVVAYAMGEPDGGDVLLRERLTERVRPDWLGGDYATWVSQW